ncbi:hypothetical protein KN63_02450 [Smithella sp. F21]|nr:hypothetical protein KN63_02450 [Smithella sp. F21]
MIINRLWKFKVIVLSSILILFLSFSFSFAQTDLSIGVAPTSKTLKLSPGEVYSDEIVFWNLSQESDTYKVFISAFQQIENQPGTAVILTPEDDAKSPYSASKWVSVEKEIITLEPNKNTKLQYTITVPQDVTNGEYNVEIFLISETNFQQAGTAAFANLASGTPFLIQIGDEFVENAELLKFVSDKKMYENINVLFLTRIKNIGDTHINPTGEIVIENIFRQEVARVPFNNSSQSLLRDTTGDYEDYWKQKSFLSPNNAIAVGPMKASLIVTYKSFQPGFAVLNAQTTFWIIPWKILLAILIVLILVIVIRTRKRKANRKNEIH